MLTGIAAQLAVFFELETILVAITTTINKWLTQTRGFVVEVVHIESWARALQRRLVTLLCKCTVHFYCVHFTSTRHLMWKPGASLPSSWMGNFVFVTLYDNYEDNDVCENLDFHFSPLSQEPRGQAHVFWWSCVFILSSTAYPNFQIAKSEHLAPCHHLHHCSIQPYFLPRQTIYIQRRKRNTRVKQNLPRTGGTTELQNARHSSSSSKLFRFPRQPPYRNISQVPVTVS